MGACRRVRQSPQCYTPFSWKMSHYKWAVETTKSQRRLWENRGSCGKASPIIICLFFALFISVSGILSQVLVIIFAHLELEVVIMVWPGKGIVKIQYEVSEAGLPSACSKEDAAMWLEWVKWEQVRVGGDDVRWGSQRPYYSWPWRQSIIRTLAFILNKTVEIWAEE